MERYETPEMEIVVFDVEDVITSSDVETETLKNSLLGI